MANENSAEKKTITEEKKRLKQEEKKQKQDIKKRAKEIRQREDLLEEEEERGNGLSSFVVTTIIVLVWIAILCFLIKLDIGGFGSEILTPLLKDVPVVNLILPGERKVTETNDTAAYGGYTSLKEAVDYIKVLELELEHAQTVNNTNADELTSLKAEVERLSEFEQMQVEFQRIKEQFYEEIIYSDNSPGPEEYRKYYESIDPTTAEALYKQVITKSLEDKEIADFVSMYSQMKPKACAEIFNNMTDDLKRVAKILKAMDSNSAADIMAAMDAPTVAKLTKIMDPDG